MFSPVIFPIKSSAYIPNTNSYYESRYHFSSEPKNDKLVKNRIPMAKKKVPPNHKIGETRKS